MLQDGGVKQARHRSASVLVSVLVCSYLLSAERTCIPLSHPSVGFQAKSLFFWGGWSVCRILVAALTVFERVGDNFISWYGSLNWFDVSSFEALPNIWHAESYLFKLKDTNVQRSEIGILCVSLVSQNKGINPSDCFIVCYPVNNLVKEYMHLWAGNNLCLWNLLPPVCGKAWKWNRSQLAWAENKGWGYHGPLLPESCKLWSDEDFWNPAVCCFAITLTIIKNSSCSGFILQAINYFLFHWFFLFYNLGSYGYRSRDSFSVASLGLVYICCLLFSMVTK